MTFMHVPVTVKTAIPVAAAQSLIMALTNHGITTWGGWAGFFASVAIVTGGLYRGMVRPGMRYFQGVNKSVEDNKEMKETLACVAADVKTMATDIKVLTEQKADAAEVARLAEQKADAAEVARLAAKIEEVEAVVTKPARKPRAKAAVTRTPRKKKETS